MHTDSSTDSVRFTGSALLSERWPTLAHAMSHYDRRLAEQFSATAYDSVDAGIIRLDQRKNLARQAESLGIRAFDAQLLIACALRQWVLDHDYDPTPSKNAPALSFEYKAWHRWWLRIGLVAATTVIMECIIVWKMLNA